MFPKNIVLSLSCTNFTHQRLSDLTVILTSLQKYKMAAKLALHFSHKTNDISYRRTSESTWTLGLLTRIKFNEESKITTCIIPK